MSVVVQTSATTFTVGNPVKVFDAKYAMPANVRSYEVSADGQRFLMIKELSEGTPMASSIVVVLNWFEELKARVPTK